MPDAVAQGDGLANLLPRDSIGQVVQLTLAGSDGKPATRVSLFDQGVVQVLQAAATGLEPKKPYVLALASNPEGQGPLEVLAPMMSSPAGTAIANAIGQIRQVVGADAKERRRYLVIAAGTPKDVGAPVQRQAER